MSSNPGHIIRRHLEAGDHTGWFEALYARANGDSGAVPWADNATNPHVLKWLLAHRVEGRGQRAAVVGCGLGDDAEELARRGFEVTAFDISQSAIRWCRDRFPDSPVHYVAADLFAPPPGWVGAFDFVLESRTIQSLPLHVREETIRRIADLVAPDGTLLVICLARDDDVAPDGPPWAVSAAELKTFETCGLTAAQFEDHIDPEITAGRKFRVTYHKDSHHERPDPKTR